MELKSVVAKNLKKYRLQSGLTQEELCNRTSIAAKGEKPINVRHYSLMENKGQNLTLETLDRLASALGVPPSRLLESDGADKHQPPSKEEMPGLEAAVRLIRGYLNLGKVQ